VLDRDESVFQDALVTELKKKCQFHFAVENFRFVDKVLDRMSVGVLDAAVLDLGLSSMQLDDSGRGFSFLKDEPLRMTFALNDERENAEVVVNEWGQETLETIIHGFGEESFARKIAAEIVLARELKRITTTTELVEIIKRATPAWYHRKRIHPATRTFQALRIAVNAELDSIEQGIPSLIAHLRPGGRLAVISFHSIEDRLVKNIFKQAVSDGQVLLVNKKPIIPKDEEVSKNPRSRSSKLRIIEKI
jgi:16S rRNA (cytosine1402-N4)-methyltransferase